MNKRERAVCISTEEKPYEPEREEPQNKLAKILRIATLPQLAALITLIIFYFTQPEFFTFGIGEMAIGIVGLTIIPLLSYAIYPLIAKKGETKRDGQRKFAVIASTFGYLICNVTAFATNATSELKAFYLTYLISAVAILIINKLGKIKCSGHSCGLFGPVAFLCLYVSFYYAFAFALLAPMFWSSMKLKRHTLGELLLGCLVTAAALAISYAVCFLA